MDPEISVMLDCASFRGLRQQQVQVEMTARFNRQNAPDLDEHIEAVWKARITKDPWLFNGAKFRLHSAAMSVPQSCSLNGAGDIAGRCHRDEENSKDITCQGDTDLQSESHTPALSSSLQTKPDWELPTLTLQLGLTCYKDFLGTNWSLEAKNLQTLGQKKFGDPQAFLAQPLGVGAVMATSDGLIVLLKRSQKVGEAPGLLDIPGGHPEPKAVCLGVCEKAINIEMMQGREADVVLEIFSSICVEIRDEVNVPQDSLSEPVLMGIALNHTSAGRPSAEFFVRCSLTAEEVRECYRRGGPESDESTDIMFLTQAEVLQIDQTSLWHELCPSAKGAVMLYQLLKPDQEDQ